MTHRRLLSLLVAAALLSAVPEGAQPADSPSAPRLLVVLVVDQMRHGYIDQMRDRWTAGMRRLVDEGAVLDETRYPYLQTVTCAGHATIGTGAFPSTHGIILNAWWRGTRSASCTEDRTATSVPYEPDGDSDGHSATQLLVPTMGDRLRAWSPESRVVTLSTKPRSAIMLAGKGGMATWLDDRDRWATSTAFSPAPEPAVASFIETHPREALRGEVWEKIGSSYTGVDDGPGEAPPSGWNAMFPHPLAGLPGTRPSRFNTLWETSPYSDVYLGQMAAHLVETLKLGQRDAVDYLGISFAALDYVGHAFGPDSHEAQDVLLRLDRTVGTLLDVLDARVGKGRYVLGLSADHGVAPIAEARVAAHESGGRVRTRELAEVANAALERRLGPGTHVVRVEYTQLYLSDAAQARVAADPGLLDEPMAALRALPGVDRVFPSDGLEGQRQSSDRTIRAAALSYVPGRSGQIVVVPKPYYVMSNPDAVGTTHGTLHDYDQHVPLIFFGAGVKAGRYTVPATPADLTPTLASRVGLTMPEADGVAHHAIFATAAPAPTP